MAIQPKNHVVNTEGWHSICSSSSVFLRFSACAEEFWRHLRAKDSFQLTSFVWKQAWLNYGLSAFWCHCLGAAQFPDIIGFIISPENVLNDKHCLNRSCCPSVFIKLRVTATNTSIPENSTKSPCLDPIKKPGAEILTIDNASTAHIYALFVCKGTICTQQIKTLLYRYNQVIKRGWETHLPFLSSASNV